MHFAKPALHPSCQILSDELYEILSSLPESVVYSCRPCSVTQPSAWRELLYIELRSGVEKVLACLLSSTLTQHLVACSQVRDWAFILLRIHYDMTIRQSHDVFCNDAVLNPVCQSGFCLSCSVRSWLILAVH